MILYRSLMRALTPFLALHAGLQRLRGRIGPGGVAERFGRGAGGVGGIWFHGASNGELTSARRVIEGLRAARPDLPIVVTSNSWTARAMVAAWAMPGVSARLAPLDTPGAVAAFRKRWQPGALIFVENELWPERIAQMAAQGPVVCLGARMSAGSARNWRRVAPGLIGGMLGRIALLSAQDAASEARFLALGLPSGRLGPRLMLKAGLVAQPAALPFTPPHPRARILLAASTHEGEEAVILRAFAQARAQFDLLILAPRHPRRSAEVAAAIRAESLPFATRSAGEVPGPETAVYLADTLGEMPGWYAMAGATVIGGTFGPAGGHTPYEPAAQGSAILHGPGVANFTEAFAALAAAQATLPVRAERLGAALAGLTAERQADLAARASGALTPADDAALMASVLAVLPQPKG
ncbi:MAG: 3-deoxy-D-manno-octulosonic acid transferase [Gemmobacter sp.]|uniref:3-deoxy-D-manno-octulosonic acid transferase n=1 Tax=Gemmobacter sp. TaxID=1898957 RepID=UPI001A5686AF|nr:glycosyltransferase N-terminal domain-containing protein [Gemmobacter sp.]MBL8563022.1 3-deoxy-D-manno-octulosonic acid transferase [Gemmobacter sp.]